MSDHCECGTERFEALSFEALLTDPMTRLVMESDRVSVGELVAVFENARTAVEQRAAHHPRTVFT